MRKKEQPPLKPRKPRAAPVLADNNFWCCLELDTSAGLSSSRSSGTQRAAKPTPPARHREALRNPPHEETTIVPPTAVDKTTSPAPSQCQPPSSGQTPVELPAAGEAEVKPTTPVGLPTAGEAEVEPTGQTGPERAHHLKTLHDKL